MTLVETLDNELKSPLKDNNTFRIQNTRFHLTYPYLVDFAAWLQWNQDNGLNISAYSMVHETGDSGYEHSHILVWYQKMIQTQKSTFFDFAGHHPNIKLVTTNKHWDNILAYHKKQNTPLVKVDLTKSKLQGRELIETIQSYPSVNEAVMNVCRSIRDVSAVVAAFNLKDIDYGSEPDVSWYPWQRELMTELTGKPDPRKIIWYWDPLGNCGKTFLAKHMGMYRGAFTTTSTNVYHVATQLQEIVKKKGAESVFVVMFNFTRDTKINKVYNAIESLKDGMITAQKYKGETIYLPIPHVVVFANYIPDVSKISIDRWNIRALNPDCKTVLLNVDSDILDKHKNDLTFWIESEYNRIRKLIRDNKPIAKSPPELISDVESSTVVNSPPISEIVDSSIVESTVPLTSEIVKSTVPTSQTIVQSGTIYNTNYPHVSFPAVQETNLIYDPTKDTTTITEKIRLGN